MIVLTLNFTLTLRLIIFFSQSIIPVNLGLIRNNNSSCLTLESLLISPTRLKLEHESVVLNSVTFTDA